MGSEPWNLQEMCPHVLFESANTHARTHALLTSGADGHRLHIHGISIDAP